MLRASLLRPIVVSFHMKSLFGIFEAQETIMKFFPSRVPKSYTLLSWETYAGQLYTCVLQCGRSKRCSCVLEALNYSRPDLYAYSSLYPLYQDNLDQL